MEKLHNCTDCPFTVTTGRQLSDHRRKEHGVQNVICPYCLKCGEFKTPSTLKSHLWLLHPLHDEELFSETGTMYYFAVKSSAYRSISKNVPGPNSATAGRACALLRQWVATCLCTSSSALLRQAEKDWAGLAHDSQTLFPGRDDLPEDLDEVLALIERDHHLPDVSDIPLPPSLPPQPLPSVPLDPPPPTFLPLAAKLVNIPAAPRVPPSPALTPQGKLPLLAMTASDLLKTGSWPALCAGVTGHRASLSKLPCLPRLSTGPFQLGPAVPREEAVGWMSQRGSSQTPALPTSWTITRSWRCRDQASAQSPKTRALGKLRVRNHQVLKTTSPKNPQLEAELVASLQGSRAAGPAWRRALLNQVQAAGIPLRPLWKLVPPPPPPPLKRPKHSVEMYSPIRPEI